mgnify:FL=1
MDETKKFVKCPICRRDVPFDDPNMPFCSDRCRLIDLGNWADEKYVIPGPPAGIPTEESESE